MIALLVIGAATLRAIPGAPPVTTQVCLFCGEYGGTDFILNVGLFVPLGIGLGLTRLRRILALVFIVAVTVTIEVMQVSFIAGRDASLGDIVANTIGGALGLVVPRAAWLWSRAPTTAMRLTAMYAGVWLCLMSVTSWLWTPSVPELSYGSQWQPRPHGFFPFAGRLLELSLNGYALEPSTMIELRSGAPPLMDGVDTVSAVFRAGPSTPSLAPIARLGRGPTEAFLLGRTRSALNFRTRLRAADARLRVPMLALEHAFAAFAPADTVHAVAGVRRGALYAQLSGNADTLSATLALTPGLGWVLLTPVTLSLGRLAVPISALWVAVTLLPLGFWGARAAVSPRRILVIVMHFLGISLLGLLVMPGLLGAQAAGAFELAAAAVGLITGFALGASQKFGSDS